MLLFTCLLCRAVIRLGPCGLLPEYPLGQPPHFQPRRRSLQATPSAQGLASAHYMGRYK